MITQVTYARLYNTGNYENIRFEAQAIVGEDGDIAAAFAEVTAAVHQAHADWKANQEAERKRQEEEWAARRAASITSKPI